MNADQIVVFVNGKLFEYGPSGGSVWKKYMHVFIGD